MFSAFEMLGTLICLLLAVGFGQSTTTKFRDPRPMYPSLKTLMLPENQIYSVFNVNSFNPSELQQPKGLVSTSSGMTYLEFYANDQCSGDVTYSTGYREGLCLPSNDYVRPPLTDEDDFYYKYPFQSLSIHNVTGNLL